jgi:hypothetical protein
MLQTTVDAGDTTPATHGATEPVRSSQPENVSHIHHLPNSNTQIAVPDLHVVPFLKEECHGAGSIVLRHCYKITVLPPTWRGSHGEDVASDNSTDRKERKLSSGSSYE